MHETNAGLYTVLRPTLRQRIALWLGFRSHIGDEPDGVDALKGWSRTEIHIDFGWTDRLRLMTTGRLRVSLTSATDTPAPAIIKNRLDWRILAPGEGEG